MITLLLLLEKASGSGNLKFLVSIPLFCWQSLLHLPLGSPLPTYGFLKIGASSLYLPSVQPALSCTQSALSHLAWPCLGVCGILSGILLLLIFTWFHDSSKCKSKICVLTRLCESQMCFSINSRDFFFCLNKSFVRVFPMPFVMYTSARWQCQGFLHFF